jgi:hypothetical protein
MSADRIDVMANVEVTPEFVANLFWGLDSGQQADFFAELERIAGISLCFQMAWVVNEIAERSERGDRKAQQGFQTMLSHAQGYAEGATQWRVARAKAAIRMGAPS